MSVEESCESYPWCPFSYWLNGHGLSVVRFQFTGQRNPGKWESTDVGISQGFSTLAYLINDALLIFGTLDDAFEWDFVLHFIAGEADVGEGGGGWSVLMMSWLGIGLVISRRSCVSSVRNILLLMLPTIILPLPAPHGIHRSQHPIV